MFKRLKRSELFDYYFDEAKDREIFERACSKCYLPSNAILLELIDKYKGEKKPVKVSFSISGVFIEQCEKYMPDVLELFKQLGETGCVEFLDQTYYHSLVGLYSDRNEFVEEVKLHRQTMQDLLNMKPTFFENTELLYNNAIGKAVDELGYNGIVTEGVDKVLRGRSPNYIYKAKKTENIKVLLRNFKLTDDIGFRFSQRSWAEWPLTADKYASWIASTTGQTIVIFPDYETFGEHHWPETGIYDFLRHMPLEILKQEQLYMATPSEAVKRHRTVGEIDVPELGGTVSWADIERDTSCWIGNTMQWAYYIATKELEPLIREAKDEELSKIWRNFLISDHLYYMFSAGGGPGEVHTYFSPYDTPMDAAITAQSAVSDFESRLKLYTVAANEPFLFYKGSGEENFTGVKAWSLKGFSDVIGEIDTESVMFHNRKGDFEKWASLSLRDDILAKKFKEIRLAKASGERLRNEVSESSKERFTTLNEATRKATQWF